MLHVHSQKRRHCVFHINCQACTRHSKDITSRNLAPMANTIQFQHATFCKSDTFPLPLEETVTFATAHDLRTSTNTEAGAARVRALLGALIQVRVARCCTRTAGTRVSWHRLRESFPAEHITHRAWRQNGGTACKSWNL